MPILRLAFDRTARRIDADGRLHVDRSHKICTACGEIKSVDAFSKRTKSQDGLQPKCKACASVTKKAWAADNVDHIRKYSETFNAKYREEHKEKLTESKRDYHRKNATKLIAKSIAWQKENRDRTNAKNANWRKLNPDACNAKSARRRAAKFKATPIWADAVTIRKIYEDAAARIGYDVDHIVPLNSPLVCGLHVTNNLQIVPSRENRAKGNKFWPDMP